MNLNSISAIAKSLKSLVAPDVNDTSINQRNNSQWNESTLEYNNHHYDRRGRSRSAPPKDSRECLRGADKFCRDQPDRHNYLGLQPKQKTVINQPRYPPRNDPQPTVQPSLYNCATCCGRNGNNNDFQDMKGRSRSCESTHRPTQTEDYRGMNYGQQQHQQPQQPRQPQQYHQPQQYQQPQQQLEESCWSSTSRSCKNVSFPNFEPALNSTMIDQESQMNGGHPPSSYAQAPLQHRQGCKATCCTSHQQPASSSMQTQIQGQRVLGNPRGEASCGMPQAQAKSVSTMTFRDQPAKCSASCCYDEGPSTSRHQTEPSYRGQYQPQAQPQPQSCCSTMKQGNCFDEEDYQEPMNMTREQLFAMVVQTEYVNKLVLDSDCRDMLQETLDGRINFNNEAFQIAYGKEIPEEPFPIDPISLLEAVNLRIDYERNSLNKKCLKAESSDGTAGKQKERESRSKKSKSKSNEDEDTNHHDDGGQSYRSPQEIDKYFSTKYKSYVNESICAFLKAESDFHNQSSSSQAGMNFSASINSHDSNFFGLPIHMKVYNATTWPID